MLNVGDKYQKLYELLIAGVAFPDQGKYLIISHMGEEIGTASRYMIEGMIAFLKRNYNKYRDAYPSPGAITYGLSYGGNDLEELMEHYRSNPLDIH